MQLGHARAQAQLAATHDLFIEGILQAMQLCGEGRALLLGVGRVCPAAHVMKQSLPTTTHLQQLAVARFAPAPWARRRCEGAVEGDAVTVALGLRQRTVDVPEQRPSSESRAPQLSGRTAAPGGRSAARRSITGQLARIGALVVAVRHAHHAQSRGARSLHVGGRIPHHERLAGRHRSSLAGRAAAAVDEACGCAAITPHHRVDPLAQSQLAQQRDRGICCGLLVTTARRSPRACSRSSPSGDTRIGMRAAVRRVSCMALVVIVEALQQQHRIDRPGPRVEPRDHALR